MVDYYVSWGIFLVMYIWIPGVMTAIYKVWTPTIYSSTDICGRTIGNTDTGGILTFNSLLLPANHKLFCRVMIQPDPIASISAAGNHVLFHFSDFNVGKRCNDASVTVLDGNGINMKPIKGLENPLCGAKSSLTNNVTFTTHSSFVTIIFQRNEAGSNFRSKFNMTFVSFAEGACGSGSEGVFSCNNSRCIDKKFTCRDWNACGDNSDCSNEELAVYFVYWGLAVIGIAALYVLYRFAKCTKKRIDKCFDCYTCNCCSNADCKPDCSEVDCSCCINLVGGVLDGCRRLKSTFTSRLESRGTSHEHREAAMEQTEQLSDIDHSVEGFYIQGLDPPRSRSTPYVPSQEGQSLVRTSSDTVLHGGRNLEIYDTPSRARGPRVYDDGDGNGLSMPESIDISGDEINYGLSYSRDHISDRHHATDIQNTDREIGNHIDAPPSYHEATTSAPPLEISFPATPDISTLPSYDEFLANQTKYGKKS